MKGIKEWIKEKPVIFIIGVLIVATLVYHWLWSDVPV